MLAVITIDMFAAATSFYSHILLIVLSQLLTVVGCGPHACIVTDTCCDNHCHACMYAAATSTYSCTLLIMPSQLFACGPHDKETL